MAFLPTYFGPRDFLKGELLVYRWIELLSDDYRGGYWHFYEIPGGFYLAPAGYTELRIRWPLNHCDCTMSADAAGIVATLYALSELCEAVRGDGLVDRYHALKAFALEHPEVAAIYAAID
ncbi:antirestriction protein [Bordetella sp. N]|uniref:antirestriction protein n=1 Tax=Bordetella sp. N TaxID=1746199 RepID=UPI0007096A30|nr:antirestriction protein [Bordetella sp. N]ALM83112.1 hypothetical protein ASB57_09235 [Bordetella sp. N]